jgi:transcriptional regulator with XRE-family HTH domain
MTGDELKQFRQALDLSQADFAKILKVSRVTIARAEKMKKLSRVVALSLDHALRDGLFRIKRTK